MARTSVSPDRPNDSGSCYRDRRDDRGYDDRPRRKDDDRRDTYDSDRRRTGYDRDGYDRRRDRDRGDERGYPGRSKPERDRSRDRERNGYKERERDREREARPGPSRRSASPRGRNSQGRSRSASKPEDSAEDKAKPNFNPSGLLAAATKTVKHGDGTSTVLKYHEPPEARKPSVGWRLYVFKGKEQVGTQCMLRPHGMMLTLVRARRVAYSQAECVFDWPRSCSGRPGHRASFLLETTCCHTMYAPSIFLVQNSSS